MADEDCGSVPTYGLESCCTPPLIGAPAAVVGPPGPTGPVSPPSFVFAFGNDKRQLATGDKISHPIPTALNGKSLTKWRIRLTSSGSVEFLIYRTDTEAGAPLALTGTMPEVTGARGASDDVSFTNTPLIAGGALEVEIVDVSAGVKQATLVLEVV